MKLRIVATLLVLTALASTGCSVKIGDDKAEQPQTTSNKVGPFDLKLSEDGKGPVTNRFDIPMISQNEGKVDFNFTSATAERMRFSSAVWAVTGCQAQQVKVTYLWAELNSSAEIARVHQVLNLGDTFDTPAGQKRTLVVAFQNLNGCNSLSFEMKVDRLKWIFDFTGSWLGAGTVEPATLWSVNQVAPGKFPRGYQTRCVVQAQVTHRADYLEVSSLGIQMPDEPDLSWFNARITHTLALSSGATEFFDEMKFKLKEKVGSPDTFELYPIRKDGTVSSSPLYGSYLSQSQQKLVIAQFGGPYVGTYKDGSGGAYTSAEALTIDSSGSTPKADVEFWSYGASVSHATDARCQSAVFKKLAI